MMKRRTVRAFSVVNKLETRGENLSIYIYNIKYLYEANIFKSISFFKTENSFD